MDKQKVTQFFKGIQKAASKKSPEILTGIGIAGMITTTVLAVKATSKALELIESEKESKKENSDKWFCSELIAYLLKPYIPTLDTDKWMTPDRLWKLLSDRIDNIYYYYMNN